MMELPLKQNIPQSTISICIFCLKRFPEVSKNRKIEKYLKPVQRYIKGYLYGQLKAEEINGRGENLGNILESCDDCLLLLKDFCRNYQEMKLLEMNLNWKLETLKAIMVSADKVSGRRKELHENLEGDIIKSVNGFRNEFVTKTSRKLKSSYPKVTLHKVPAKALKEYMNPGNRVKTIISGLDNGDVKPQIPILKQFSQVVPESQIICKQEPELDYNEEEDSTKNAVAGPSFAEIDFEEPTNEDEDINESLLLLRDPLSEPEDTTQTANEIDLNTVQSLMETQHRTGYESSFMSNQCGNNQNLEDCDETIVPVQMEGESILKINRCPTNYVTLLNPRSAGKIAKQGFVQTANPLLSRILSSRTIPPHPLFPRKSKRKQSLNSFTKHRSNASLLHTTELESFAKTAEVMGTAPRPIFKPTESRSQIQENGRRRRSRPTNDTDRHVRKKLQNCKAAMIYREKKKQELMEILAKEEKLQQVNYELEQEKKRIGAEIRTHKSLLLDVLRNFKNKHQSRPRLSAIKKQ